MGRRSAVLPHRDDHHRTPVTVGVITSVGRLGVHPERSEENQRMARPDDVDALTDAVLTASRLLVAVSARSIAAVEDTITLAQFRLLVVLDSRGPMKLIGLAELLAVNPSAATRM